MKDKDILAGKKIILEFLQLSSFYAVLKRKDKEGLPVVKVCGRWEMSLKAYEEWKHKKYAGGVAV